MPLSLNEGEVLRGRYKVQERIGQGGAGSIYLANDLRLEGRQCALKEVEYDRALSENLLEEARQQFFREATILALPRSSQPAKSFGFLFQWAARLSRHGLRPWQGPANHGFGCSP